MLCYLIPSIPSHSLRFCGKNRPLIIAALSCPPRSRTSLLGTKIRCNTDIRVDTKNRSIFQKRVQKYCFFLTYANFAALFCTFLCFFLFGDYQIVVLFAFLEEQILAVEQCGVGKRSSRIRQFLFVERETVCLNHLTCLTLTRKDICLFGQ